MGYRVDAGIDRADANEPLDFKTVYAVLAFLAVALYNVIELNFIIFATFKKYSGLYFWSFLVSTNGIAFYSVGFMVKALRITFNAKLYVTLIEIGWTTMVTGQSVVLFSRLHLIVRNSRYMKLILGMIVFNAIICHIPIIVMTYGANSSNPGPWVLPYSIYEKVQVTIFFIQELIISGMYIYHCVSSFALQTALRPDVAKKMRNHLIWVNAVIILLDITILGLEYAGLYTLQTSYKALVYSVKLKMEFSILNQLVELTKAKVGNGGGMNSYARTNPYGTGMHLETIDGERKHRSSSMGGKNGASSVGYNAFVRIGDQSSDIVRRDDAIVVTTATKIEHDQKIDDESVRSVDVGQNDPVAKVKASPSSSSSEVQFAREGY